MRTSIFLLGMLIIHHASAESLPLLQRMTETGITIVDDQTCVLPKPSLWVGQDAAARKEILDDLAGGRGWKNFSRRSISAPVAIKVQYLKDADGQRIGHQVHSAFIVHAPLATLKNEDVMEQLFGKPDDSEETEDFALQELKPEELESVGIKSVGENESYGAIQVPLLKRVIVRGVIRTQRSVTDDRVTVVWEIDPRFTGADGRNTWALIERDDLGKKLEGDQSPYRGAGGYMCISKLPEVENACLVESQIVLHEPADWFRGSNVLRSKLPILMQESARNFRRKLMDK